MADRLDAPEQQDAPEAQIIPSAPTPLTTPCTLPQLRNWLKGVDVTTPGWETHASITTTASGISVA